MGEPPESTWRVALFATMDLRPCDVPAIDFKGMPYGRNSRVHHALRRNRKLKQSVPPTKMDPCKGSRAAALAAFSTR